MSVSLQPTTIFREIASYFKLVKIARWGHKKKNFELHQWATGKSSLNLPHSMLIHEMCCCHLKVGMRVISIRFLSLYQHFSCLQAFINTPHSTKLQADGERAMYILNYITRAERKSSQCPKIVFLIRKKK